MPSSVVARCYYEVIGVDQKATREDIRCAYRKKSLLYHPDRNYNNEAEATIKFKELLNAYSILNDEYERAWYDAHRNQILYGLKDNDDDNSSHDLNLYQYFTENCFEEYDDAEDGFYSVYRAVFESIAAEEALHDTRTKEWLKFGDSNTPWDEVRRFYSFWRNFNTQRNFCWKDEYKINEIGDRGSRRAAERVNQKNRLAAKKEYTQTVQNLAHFAHRRDPRVKAQMAREEAEESAHREENARLDAERQRRRRNAKARLWAEGAELEERQEAERRARGETMDGSTFDMLYAQQKHVEELKKTQAGTYGGMHGFAMLSNDDKANSSNAGAAVGESDGTVKLSCTACNKKFTTESLYKEHMQSRKHKTRLKQVLAKQGAKQEVQKTDEVDTHVCHEDDTSDEVQQA